MKAGYWTAIIVGIIAALASAGVFMSRRGADTETVVAPGSSEAIVGVEAAASGDPQPARGVRDPIAPPDLATAASASAFAAAPILVLAPQGMAEADAAAFDKSFKVTPQGYFARLKRAEYDIVINGTRSFAVAPAASTVVRRENGEYLIEAAEGGLNVSFNREGADYLIEFMCRSAEAADDGCITEDEAADLAASLVAVGGAGR